MSGFLWQVGGPAARRSATGQMVSQMAMYAMMMAAMGRRWATRLPILQVDVGPMMMIAGRDDYCAGRLAGGTGLWGRGGASNVAMM